MAGWNPIMEEAVNHRSFGAYYAGGMACGKGRVANVRTLHRTDVYGCEVSVVCVQCAAHTGYIIIG